MVWIIIQITVINSFTSKLRFWFANRWPKSWCWFTNRCHASTKSREDARVYYTLLYPRLNLQEAITSPSDENRRVSRVWHVFTCIYIVGSCLLVFTSWLNRDRRALRILPSYLKRKAGRQSGKNPKKARTVKAWDRDILCIPQSSLNVQRGGNLSYPRGRYRAQLARAGLIGKLHLTWAGAHKGKERATAFHVNTNLLRSSALWLLVCSSCGFTHIYLHVCRRYIFSHISRATAQYPRWLQFSRCFR